MEKNSVKQEKVPKNVPGLKESSLNKEETVRCPECSKLIERHGAVWWCPTHGSAPWE